MASCRRGETVDDREEGSTLRTVATVGIDLANYVFQLSAVGAREQDVFRQRLSRNALKQFLATFHPWTLRLRQSSFSRIPQALQGRPIHVFCAAPLGNMLLSPPLFRVR
jgi:hypothetical protein